MITGLQGTGVAQTSGYENHRTAIITFSIYMDGLCRNHFRAA